jgi:hypothetical protein
MTWEEERKEVYKILKEVHLLDTTDEYLVDRLDGIQCRLKNHLIKLNKSKKESNETKRINGSDET